MTEQFKRFLQEFADLLEKHEVSFEATEKCRDWQSCCDGIDIDQKWKYGAGLETLREGASIKMGKYIDADEIRRILES